MCFSFSIEESYIHAYADSPFRANIYSRIEESGTVGHILPRISKIQIYDDFWVMSWIYNTMGLLIRNTYIKIYPVLIAIRTPGADL